MNKKDKKDNIPKQGIVYGYLRVSTDEQTLENNKHVIEKKKEELNLIGPIEWIEEKISGTIHWKKRELGKYLEIFKEGDILIMSELSRISRIGLEIQEFISNIVQKKVRIYSLDVPIIIDGSYLSMMFINGIALGAQLERDFISTRTKNALEMRKQNGQKLGRPKGRRNKVLKLEPFKDQIGRMLIMGIKQKKIAKDYKVTQATLCSFIKEHNLKVKII
jgi:DNA invertase Pin-like site-specific DNA recombinase